MSSRLVPKGIDPATGQLDVNRYPNADPRHTYIYERDFDKFDYKVGLDYGPREDVMPYVATQTEFQPGRFNPYSSTPQ